MLYAMSLAAGTLLGGIGLLSLSAGQPATPSRPVPPTLFAAPAPPEASARRVQRATADPFAVTAAAPTLQGTAQTSPVALPIGRTVNVRLDPRAGRNGSVVEVFGTLVASDADWLHVRTADSELYLARAQIAAIVVKSGS